MYSVTSDPAASVSFQTRRRSLPGPTRRSRPTTVSARWSTATSRPPPHDPLPRAAQPTTAPQPPRATAVRQRCAGRAATIRRRATPHPPTPRPAPIRRIRTPRPSRLPTPMPMRRAQRSRSNSSGSKSDDAKSTDKPCFRQERHGRSARLGAARQHTSDDAERGRGCDPGTDDVGQCRPRPRRHPATATAPLAIAAAAIAASTAAAAAPAAHRRRSRPIPLQPLQRLPAAATSAAALPLQRWLPQRR